MLSRTAIDVLVRDIGMPGADGYDLILDVRETEIDPATLAELVAKDTREGE